jgi:hypothetical protein
VLAFDINKNSRFGRFRQNMMVICSLIESKSLLLLNPYMFPWHKPYYVVFWWRPFIGQNSLSLSFNINKNSRFGHFWPKIMVISPLIVNESLLLLNSYMFRWHKPHYLVFGGVCLSIKNSEVLAFDINENSHFRHFRPKMLVICPLIVIESLLLLTRHMFYWH